jgi:3-oxoacyl-[acyl-carrier protein] reductase
MGRKPAKSSLLIWETKIILCTIDERSHMTRPKKEDLSGNPAALVTGGGRGIGRAIAIEVAKLGYNVAINYVRNRKAATDTRLECLTAAESSQRRIDVGICKADIGKAPARAYLVDFLRERFGRLDLLVNNAGIPPTVRADLLDATEKSFSDVLSTNLTGPYFLTQVAARWMADQKKRHPERKPKVVFIGSISATSVSTNRGEYCISKAGIAMAAKLYATRLAEYGINVYEIRPGIIETDMVRPVKEKYNRLIQKGVIPLRRWGQPEDVGKIVAAIAQDLLPFSTGEVIYADGGLHIERL